MARVSISLSTQDGSSVHLACPSEAFSECVLIDYETYLPGGDAIFERGSISFHGTREDLRGLADLIYAGTRTRQEIDAAGADVAVANLVIGDLGLVVR